MCYADKFQVKKESVVFLLKLDVRLSKTEKLFLAGLSQSSVRIFFCECEDSTSIYATCDLCVKIIQPKQQHKPTMSFRWTWAFKFKFLSLNLTLITASLFQQKSTFITISVFHYFEEISQPQSCSKAPWLYTVSDKFKVPIATNYYLHFNKKFICVLSSQIFDYFLLLLLLLLCNNCY